MNSPGKIPLSVIMPAYNEEGSIENAVRDIQRHVLKFLPEAEVIVVDDGSRDQTGKILDQLAMEDSHLHVIHQPNGGHGRALYTGMNTAKGEYFFLIDSDRQIPLEAFGELWTASVNRDGAFGIRAERQDPYLRLILARCIRRALKWLFGFQIRDANIPFKIFKKSIWEQAREIIPEDTLAPSLFIGIYVRWYGFNVAEYETPHRKRVTGVNSIRHWRLLRFCARALMQLMAFRKRLRS